jgi:hypothetical protein
MAVIPNGRTLEYRVYAADELLESEYDAILALNANRCATVLDRLDRVFDLEVSTIGGEDRVGQVVARAY